MQYKLTSLILCGGKGSRLKKLGKKKPKCLVKIKGKYFAQVINTYNRKNIFRYFYTTQNLEGVDDDGDWDILTDDINGDGEAGYYFDGNQWVPEPNVDEADENIPQKRELSIFPLIPTIGFSIEF